MVLVGVLLLSGLGLMAIEMVGYTRGGYNSAFWKLPLDDKLDHVAVHRREWWWISISSVVSLTVLSSGVYGLAFLLGDAGAPVVASVALGGYTVAAAAWLFGLVVQTAAVPEAAQQRAVARTTPSWLHPMWKGAFLTELTWIVGANIAYALMGYAILTTDLVADWAGWCAMVAGPLTAIGVLITRDGFPQLGYLLPAVIGIALLLT